ncbi:MAG: hypothetical protein AAGB12_12805 [Pseudomonadota bacterium]
MRHNNKALRLLIDYLFMPFRNVVYGFSFQSINLSLIPIEPLEQARVAQALQTQAIAVWQEH